MEKNTVNEGCQIGEYSTDDDPDWVRKYCKAQ